MSTVASTTPARTTSAQAASARATSAYRAGLTLLVVAAVYEATARSGAFPPALLPTLPKVAATLWELLLDGTMLEHAAYTMYRVLFGLALAVAVGLPLGILMGWYSRVDAVLDPFVSALYATPRIALLPLVMIWFGIGLMSKVAIVFLGAIFPILVNTITGVRTVNADFVKVARSFGSNDWQMFLTVVLPSSVPLLLTGLRLGLGHALVGIVVGEMYGATHGLGFLIATAGARFRPTR